MFVPGNDTSIWDSFLAGNDQAYEYIYKNHVQKLFLYGITLTKDEELVKDCIQDVFTRIYENRQSLSKADNIRLYLIAALRNAILSAFRKQNSYHTFINTLETEELIDDKTEIERIIHREEETEKEELIHRLCSVITDRQREIIYYRYVEGMKLEEISEMLNIEYHSVANVIQRALKKMKKFHDKTD